MVFGIYKAVILLLKSKFDKILIQMKNMIFYIKNLRCFKLFFVKCFEK